MISLRDIFKRYTGPLRGMKAVYVFNNFLNAAKLRKNKALYRQYGLKKSVLSPIGSHDFAQHSDAVPWLDRPNGMEALLQHPTYLSMPAAEQAQVRSFVDNGFLILRGFYSADEVQQVNREIEKLLSENRAGFNYTGKKIMDAWRFSPLIEQHFFKNQRLLQLLDFLMGTKTAPFQTIHFLEGSEQRAHSDFIHMTTEPPGYLIASWTALEATHEGNGLLFYYPGSHRLPYIMCGDYDSGNSRWSLGENSYRNYEAKIAQLVAEHDLKKEYFFAKTGDVLIWHANLLHGGSPIKQPGSTRRSMVAHYFCEGVICYHEISQRPAIL